MNRLQANRTARFGFALLLVALLPLAGCAWRTSRADHVLGPAFYRFSGGVWSTNGAIIQTIHAPLLLEGGRQWGVNVGAIDRFAITPSSIGSHGRQSQAKSLPRALLFHSQPGRWQFSPVYLRAPLRATPVFIRRRVAGAAGGAGGEQSFLSLGYSDATWTTPREQGVYQLEFKSRSPLDATLVVTPAANSPPENLKSSHQQKSP